MKKNSLLKAIVIACIVFAVLSWFIPVGYYNSGEFIKEATEPIGIFDIIRYPLITATSSLFILTSITILVIGGFYGVLNKTGVYSKLVEGISKKFKEKEKVFLVITVLVFGILSSLSGLTLPLFALVPLFATIILLLGYNRFTAMISTVGSILVGNLASIYGHNVAGYISYLTENIHDSILIRILLFILTIGVLLFTAIKTAKLEKNKNKEEIIPLYEKNINKKKTTTSMLIVFVLAMIVIFVGMFNWEEVFGITLFTDLYTNIQNFKIGEYPIFANIIGSIGAIGTWTNYELSLFLILGALIIGYLYELKTKDIVSSFVDGTKKMLPVALYTLAASIIFLLMNTNEYGYTFFSTICNWILSLSEDAGMFLWGIVSFIGSFFYNDFPYFVNSVYAPIVNAFTKFSMIGVLTQSIHGFVQLIAPTSIILVAGLTYFEIPYIDWLKKMWKTLLAIFAAIIIIMIAMIILA